MKYIYKNRKWKINKDYKLDKLLYLMIDRPNKTYSNCIFWENKKRQYHRNYDLPSYSFIRIDGSCVIYWSKNSMWYKSID